MKTLVVYYSRTGRTKKVAEAIAQKLQCDIEEILDTKKRTGLIGFLRSGRHSMKKKLTVLKPIKNDPALYDLVLIGTPIWADSISTPIRTYLCEQKDHLKKVGFFATYGSGADSAFMEMRVLCGKEPVGILDASVTEVDTEAFKEKLNQFANTLKQL